MSASSDAGLRSGTTTLLISPWADSDPLPPWQEIINECLRS
jgi:hypothetical protein